MADIAAIEAQTLAAEEAVQAAARGCRGQERRGSRSGLCAGQLKPRSRRWPSCSSPPATAACRPCSIRSRWRRATRWRWPRRWATTSTRRRPRRRPCTGALNAAAEPDPALPPGVEPLAAHVAAPPELARRLEQIGVVRRADGARLQRRLEPGQRLVSPEGDLWRWDGFVAAAQGAIAAASRLPERSRLGVLAGAGGAAAPRRRGSARPGGRSRRALRAAQAEERRLRQLWREARASWPRRATC